MDSRPLTVPVTFTLDELWFLQSLVRHELPQPPEWKFPPASLDLNDQVADALVACSQNGLKECALVLTRGDLLLLDYVVPNGYKDAAGKLVGRDILLRTFVARRRLAEGPEATAVEPDDTEQWARLSAYKDAGAPKHPRRSRKLRKEIE